MSSQSPASGYSLLYALKRAVCLTEERITTAAIVTSGEKGDGSQSMQPTWLIRVKMDGTG